MELGFILLVSKDPTQTLVLERKRAGGGERGERERLMVMGVGRAAGQDRCGNEEGWVTGVKAGTEPLVWKLEIQIHLNKGRDRGEGTGRGMEQ